MDRKFPLEKERGVSFPFLTSCEMFFMCCRLACQLYRCVYKYLENIRYMRDMYMVPAQWILDPALVYVNGSCESSPNVCVETLWPYL